MSGRLGHLVEGGGRIFAMGNWPEVTLPSP